MATTPNRATRRSTTSTSKPKTSAPKKAPAPAKPKQEEGILTLANIDAEASEVVTELEGVKPFVLEVGKDEEGESIKVSLSHPALLPYDIVASGDQDAVLAASMSEEDYDRFLDAGLNTIQAGVIFAMWRKHYGTGSLGE